MDFPDLELIPANAPLSENQRAWMNGYLAGLLSAKRLAASSSGTPVLPDRGPLLFLFGSQTGSAEALARKFAKQARSIGFESKCLALDEHTAVDLTAQKRIAIVTSTYGDGEMPDNAQAFWEFIRNGSAPQLAHTQFAVLALGDSNYVRFCEAGKLIDRRLEELGATRIQPRIDCDVDFDKEGAAWFASLMDHLGCQDPHPATEAPADTAYSKSNPYPATLKICRRLNGEGSGKDTRHIELLLGDSGLDYEVGDALGVFPQNCLAFVQEILDAAGLDGEEPVPASPAGPTSLRMALVGSYDLKPFLGALPENPTSAADLVAPLKKLQPRLYSISSSPKAHPGEVHLTVGVVRYQLHGRPRVGVCSTFLADRVAPGATVPVFVHRSPGFKPPADPSTPMIMVGPGTGIAPFRAFLEERHASGAAGPNWLFFGDQKLSCDFLYRDELEAMFSSGLLTRLDTAFSRDQSEKIYVQTRMRERGADLWQWICDGAHLYVCGDASRMAKDVDSALRDIVATHSGLGENGADDFVAQLKRDKRYQRDVY